MYNLRKIYQKMWSACHRLNGKYGIWYEFSEKRNNWITQTTNNSNNWWPWGRECVWISVCVIFGELRISRLTIDDLHHIKEICTHHVLAQQLYDFGHLLAAVAGISFCIFSFFFVFTFLCSNRNDHIQPTKMNSKIIQYFGLNADDVDNIRETI